MGAELNYIELPVDDLAAARRFYGDALGWTFDDYGPSYAATTTGGTGLGLQGDAAEATRAALPVVEVVSLDAALAAVIAAGGVVTRPAFAFPGGRRFHFRDPAGNELAAMQAE